MSRRRKNRKHIKRARIRKGIEQLENRTLPGGFLDLLAGAAFVAHFDLLDETELKPEQVDAVVAKHSAASSATTTLASNALVGSIFAGADSGPLDQLDRRHDAVDSSPPLIAMRNVERAFPEWGASLALSPLPESHTTSGTPSLAVTHRAERRALGVLFPNSAPTHSAIQRRLSVPM